MRLGGRTGGVDDDYVPPVDDSSSEEFNPDEEEVVDVFEHDEGAPGLDGDCSSPCDDVDGHRPLGVRKRVSPSSNRHVDNKKAVKKQRTTVVSRPPGSAKDRKRAASLVTHLPILVTGCRQGEIIVGTKTQSKGAVLKIHDGTVPPSKKELDLIRAYEDLWRTFLRKLGAIEAFSHMSLDERQAWLKGAESPRDVYIQDVDGLMVEVLHLAGDFLRLPEEHIERLGVPGGVFPIMDVVSMFPGKPGSSGLLGRHTLIFRRGIWKVSVVYRESREVPLGVPVVDVERGAILRHGDGGGAVGDDEVVLLFDSFAKTYAKKGKKYVVSQEQTVAFLVQSTKTPFSEDGVWNVVLSHPCVRRGRFTTEDVDAIRFHTRSFTAASYKSFMQKIVRFRPRMIHFPRLVARNRHDDVDDVDDDVRSVEYPSDFVLCVCFASLLLHPGSFVPDIQRYVTGMESALKRLLVTLFEDAYIPTAREQEEYTTIMVDPRVAGGDGGHFERVALSAAAGAYLAQRCGGVWRPSYSMLSNLLTLACGALESPRVHQYDISKGSKLAPFTLAPRGGGGKRGASKASPLAACSALLDEVKSFQSDLMMIRHIASQRCNSAASGGRDGGEQLPKRPNAMSIYHCVDQHWAPEIAYACDLKIIRNLSVGGSRPFGKLFIHLFSRLTGVNPRRRSRRGRTMHPQGWSGEESFEKMGFTIAMRRAQRLILMARQLSREELKPRRRIGRGDTGCRDDGGGDGDDALVLEYVLDDGWIAGLLGAVEVSGRPPALVTLHPDDPELFVAVRKPSRAMKDPMLSDAREAQAISSVRRLLRSKQGLPLRAANVPISMMKGARLALRVQPIDDDDDASGDAGDEEFYLLLGKDGRREASSGVVRWEEFRKGVVRIPYVESLELTLENALSHRGGVGVVVDADARLRRLLLDSSRHSVRRALFYISCYGGVVEMARVGREGGGTKQAVSIHDAECWQLLLRISLLYPSALDRVPHQPLKFKVPNGPLLWHVRDLLAKHLAAAGHEAHCASAKKDSAREDPSCVSSSWGRVHDRRERIPWEHQRTSLDEMKKAHTDGRKGHFIWIDVGMGKTWIVLRYMQWLLSIGQCPTYVIYTLPSSAICSIREEVEAFGMRCVVLVPLKKLGKAYVDECGNALQHVVQGCRPPSHCVCLIEHDHLRRCEDELSDVMGDAVFIIDEVHKCLNDSKRTATALQLSRLSQEFVALTGTPIIDSNTYKLIWWLEQIVPFEVNETNFWVAANGMVAKKVNTGVKVLRREVEAVLGADELLEYAQLVPPNMGGKNACPRPEDFRKAMELCYAASGRRMVEEVSLAVDHGHGVFVVAKDVAHQAWLSAQVVKRVKGLKRKDVFLIKRGQSLFLTSEAVESGKVHPYRVVITTIRHSEGYTLTHLDTMITCVYPSNNATREQLEGRINRIGQHSSTVHYHVVHAGILTYILQRHNDARNLSAVLSALADDIVM